MMLLCYDDTRILLKNSIECKHPAWNYTGKGREQAQQAYLSLVASKGGIAQFSTGDAYV